MTGRRLYELVCDARYDNFYPRYEGGVASLTTDEVGDDQTPPAWAYLKRSERKTWNAVAVRLKGVKR